MNNNEYDIGPNKKGNLVQLLFGSLCSTACPCEQGSKAKPSSFKGFPWKFPRRVVVEPSAGAISKQSHLNSEPSSTNHLDLLIGKSQLQTGVQVPPPQKKRKFHSPKRGHQMEGMKASASLCRIVSPTKLSEFEKSRLNGAKLCWLPCYNTCMESTYLYLLYETIKIN